MPKKTGYARPLPKIERRQPQAKQAAMKQHTKAARKGFRRRQREGYA